MILQADPLDTGIAIVIVLFILSMISERVVTWVKLQFGKENGILPVLRGVRKEPETEEEKKRKEVKVLGLNLVLSIVIAILANANLFEILKNEKPYEAIGWDNDMGNFFLWFIGCMLTGFFISLGSKFWHDLLDMLFEVKNLKKKLNDPETYKVDNVKSLEKILSTYESDFVKLAFLEARSKYMAMENVKTVSLKQDDTGYYIELLVQHRDPGLGNVYQYILDDGTVKNVNVKIRELGGLVNEAFAVDLSAKIFERSQPANYGTLGCIVKRNINGDEKQYLLTCCHNVVHPVTKVPVNDKIYVSTIDNNILTPLGTAIEPIFNTEADAILIDVDELNKKVANRAPGMGKPQKPRQVLKKDKGTKVYLHGATSENKKGEIVSVYTSAKINYKNAGEHELKNLIVVSDFGLGIAKGGDSGCCVLDSHSNLIGLVVGGNVYETYVIPITTLLTITKTELA